MQGSRPHVNSNFEGETCNVHRARAVAKLQKLESIISQVTDNQEDGAQWICTYLGNHYEDAFKTSATQLGCLSIVRMNPYDVIAMFNYANVTQSHMQTINQYVKRCLGNKVFIPGYKFRDEVT
jgi:hypothetical protein